MENPNHRSTTLTPDWDTTLNALTASRRRVVLAELEDAGGALSVDDLVTTISKVENQHSEASIERVGLSLLHVHLPHLMDSGFVTMASEDRVRLSRAAYDHPLALPLAQWSQDPGSIPSPLFDTAQSD